MERQREERSHKAEQAEERTFQRSDDAGSTRAVPCDGASGEDRAALRTPEDQHPVTAGTTPPECWQKHVATSYYTK